MMDDIRPKGEVVDFGPEAQAVVRGFRITLTKEMETVYSVKFEVDNFTMRGWMWDHVQIICPRCEMRLEESEDYLAHLRYEDHLHMRHGYELHPAHPLARRTPMQKLIDWLFDYDMKDIREMTRT